MAAAGAADEVDAGSIDTCVATGVGDGVEDVLRGQVRGAGFRPAVRTAEIGSDEHPAHLLGLGDPRRALLEAAAPRVQEDDERHRGAGGVMGGGLRSPIDDFLQGAILRARDIDGELHRGRARLRGGRTFRRDLGFGGEGDDGEEEREESHFSSGRRAALT